MRDCRDPDAADDEETIINLRRDDEPAARTAWRRAPQTLDRLEHPMTEAVLAKLEGSPTGARGRTVTAGRFASFRRR
ncbi:hypothetical protein [Dactylosporangium sp. CA-233914]|uniref:hypothetical protein n=1 Tax=Dactylosporangium sp. CA-233914 TaxID=3239934 RepID=UPI003D9402C3